MDIPSEAKTDDGSHTDLHPDEERTNEAKWIKGLRNYREGQALRELEAVHHLLGQEHLPALLLDLDLVDMREVEAVRLRPPFMTQYGAEFLEGLRRVVRSGGHKGLDTKTSFAEDT